MYTLFTAHPHKVNETYGEHFMIASRIGTQMVIGGFACIIHALFPFLFERTGSDTIYKLATMITERRNRAEGCDKEGGI
jgi:hypothetical protein